MADDVDVDEEEHSQYDRQSQVEEGGVRQSMESLSVLLSDDIISSVVSSAKDNTEKINDYASSLVTNIVDAAKAKVLATPTKTTPSRGVSDYVDDVATSIMSEVKRDLMEGQITAASVKVPSQTEGHTSNNKVSSYIHFTTHSLSPVLSPLRKTLMCPRVVPLVSQVSPCCL